MPDLNAELRGADALAVRDNGAERVLAGIRVDAGAAVGDAAAPLHTCRLDDHQRGARVRQHAEMRRVPWARNAVVRAVLAHRRDDDAVGEFKLVDFVWRKQRAGHGALGLERGGVWRGAWVTARNG